MSFYFTLYWLDSKKTPRVLTGNHASDPDNRIIKWIEIEERFKDGFVSFLQNFLRTKTSWCYEFVGTDMEAQIKNLEPYYGDSIHLHEDLLLTCEMGDLKSRLENEQHQPWYWPFRSVYADDLGTLVQMIEAEINVKRTKKFSLDSIKILFQF